MPSRARLYQIEIAALLERHFGEVRIEWSVVKDATDDFAADVKRYAPRVDVAVGPFNTTPGPDLRLTEALLPDSARRLFAGLPANPNPRCLLAIEVAYSGTSKHMLGDLLNAGALGMYGIVIGADDELPKIRRIRRYLELLATLEKLPWLFRNVQALSAVEFEAAFA